MHMGYDEGLAQRVRELFEEHPGFVEKKMFGGLCFLLHGNMASGILKDELIARVGPNNYEAALKKPHTKKFDITGRPMTGWVVVKSEGLESDDDLAAWVQMGMDFALSLPVK